jgi:hypothetical protein
MGQTIFYPGLNEFCRKYLVTNTEVAPADVAQFPLRLQQENASLFEQFMLFDKISFKVYGENILVPYLIAQLGQNAFESLVEQGAIGFTLWTPVVTFLMQDIPGVMALQSGTQSSPAHSRKERRQLVRKLLPLYRVTAPRLAAVAVGITASAFQSGKLKALNFSSQGKDIQNLALPERKALCHCATELLEYSYLIQNQMTSFSSHPYFALFDESAGKITAQTTLVTDFNRLAQVEQFPDLQYLYGELKIPFTKLVQLRKKRSSVAFRKWLAEANSAAPDGEIVKEYIDSIADTKGFFETRSGKITKSVAMTALAAGIGAAVGGAEGAVKGAILGKGLEVGADFALDLVDEFLLSKLTKGWSPKMFIDDLEKLRRPSA